MITASAVAVTGANGRLGKALVDELRGREVAALAWSRPDYELDDSLAAKRLIARDSPATVLHPAAWTDVDGCSLEPALAYRRNALAAGELAQECAAKGIRMLLVSTNEVFDGKRNDGRGYVETDAVAPISAYGQSKLDGERLAVRTFAEAGRPDLLWVVRTAWLFGPPGDDFPTKIVAAADRLERGAPLRVVSDEIGSPTFTPDLASAMIDLIERAPAGTYHVCGAGHASRFEVARAVLDQCRPGTLMEPIKQSDFVRASSPPLWGVLDTARADSFGVRMRSWRAALTDYLSALPAG